MKKVFVFMAALAMALLCGCGYSESNTEQEQPSPVMEVVYRSSLIGWIIVRDTRTGVQYLRASNGGVCVMVNPDGTPYTGEVEG